MTTYRVADAQSDLERLIDLALEGQEVIISRDGKPIAELRPIRTTAPAPSKALYERMKARRDSLPAVGVTSMELLDQMYDDPEG